MRSLRSTTTARAPATGRALEERAPEERAPRVDTRAPRAKVLLLANTAFYLLRFRTGLIEELLAAGYDVLTLSPGEPEEFAQLEGLGATPRPWTLEPSRLRPRGDGRALRELRACLRSDTPDLVLTFTTKPAILAGACPRHLLPPRISTLTGLGTAALGSRLTRCMARTLLRFTLPTADRLVVQNRSDREWISGLLRQATPPTSLVPGSGIDTEGLRTTCRPPLVVGHESKAPFIFLFIGRLLRQKGVPELLEATRRLRETHSNFEVHLAGAPSTNSSALNLDELRRSAPPEVRFLGWRGDIPDLIAGSDCVVLPSWREGMSRSLLEALAIGRPLIATNVPGCRELVTNGVNGYLAPPRNPEALAFAMRSMLSLPDAARDEFAAASREHAAPFDHRTINARYLRMVEELLPRLSRRALSVNADARQGAAAVGG